MSIVALERVLLVHPLGDFGDRNIQGISTPIASDSWLLEADYHKGNIGDVTLYRNTSALTKGVAPTWEWYCAIPTVNIKAYRLVGDKPSPSTLTDGKPEAAPQEVVTGGAARSARA